MNSFEKGPNCAGCGACLAICPVYRISFLERHSPRGKYHLLVKGLDKLPGSIADMMVRDTMTACLQCGGCASVCAAGVDVRSIIRERREKEASASLTVRKALKIMENGPLRGTGLALKLLSMFPGFQGIDSWSPAERPFLTAIRQEDNMLSVYPPPSAPVDPHRLKIAFFAGCVQNFMMPGVAEDALNLLSREIVIPLQQGCCGLAALSAGLTEMAREQAAKNIKIFSAIQPDILLTGCASCASMLSDYKKLFPQGDPLHEQAAWISDSVRELSSFLASEEQLLCRITGPFEYGNQTCLSDLLPFALQVPCHDRFSPGGSSDIQKLFERMGITPAITLGCCGFGGSFFIGNRKLSAGIRDTLVSEVRRAGVKRVVTNCSGCLMHLEMAYRKGDLGEARPLHLARFLSLLP